MRRSTWILAATLAVAGCGDDEMSADSTADGTGSTGSGPTTGTPGTTSGNPATASSSGEDSGSTGAPGTDTTEGPADSSGTQGATDTGATDTGGSDTGATDTGGMAMVDASISNVMFFQDCMPIVPPDPLGASFTLSLDNSGPGVVPASADIVAVEVYDAGMVNVGSFDVMPTELGPVPPGEIDMFAITKTAGSLMPPNGCGVLMCNGNYTIEVELDVDGQTVMADGAGQVACVF